MINEILKKRILDISYKYKLSHIGSCLTAVDIIDEIYRTKKPYEKFILSSGHAGVALYCVIEKYEGIDAEKIWLHHGTHPDRCKDCQIYCSSGSLGHGIGIGVGMALSDRSKNIYVLLSDGECAEGAVWESIRVAQDQNLKNIKIYVNCNGWAAYKQVKFHQIITQYYGFPNVQIEYKTTNFDEFPFLQGQDAHYHILTKEEYEKI